MATKTTKQAAKPIVTKDRYYYAVGRRKTAVAQVRLFVVADAKEAEMVVNNRPFKEYFGAATLQQVATEPLRSTGKQQQFRVSLLVKGGGLAGQADASRLAIARALIEFDAGLRPVLKAGGLLVRDAREVERKKPGLKKARRAPQWSKR